MPSDTKPVLVTAPMQHVHQATNHACMPIAIQPSEHFKSEN